MPKMVLIRHGESQWNLENRFTGWIDVPLSPKGEQEAREKPGRKFAAFRFDEAFTSVSNTREGNVEDRSRSH